MSPRGLRSLAATDPAFGKSPDFGPAKHRGDVFVAENYLILRGLATRVVWRRYGSPRFSAVREREFCLRRIRCDEDMRMRGKTW